METGKPVKNWDNTRSLRFWTN